MNIGDALPEISMTLDPVRLVLYAGASWDWHRLHHDAGFAEAVGLPAPIADGQMFGALFVEQLALYLGPESRVERMAFRFRSMVFAGEAVRVTGEVVSIEAGGDFEQVTCEQRLSVADRLCSTATTVGRRPV